ncbi:MULTISPECIES: ArsR/SmtB family transcription factor [Enterococcus]|uniref:Transcriptional regulator n=1 Tax=Enterococcus thailandicus TaxID=417368 RepID=A0A179EU17_ENTTH|nr:MULTISPECIES: helix-turn-helix domain-containing protein [Enterococcus]ASZ07612.1 transcriptional regulator [Enterococcus thailandicus]MDK4351044.1 ArsR family transcriptional regulator [Enterococcus thailandicus]MDT2733304.1 ArsR family transcriptional regulator [Enterococcus thailandicus]MDT2750698.1 ArsR family transcriptional regulator [Enterococcus thailandicus]MDT2775257.1 ArsR family transcriptional regulator [Enterococcus thailandicus]
MELSLDERSLPVFECLASATRLEILKFIGSEKKSIGEIAKHLEISSAITTRHIQKMEDAGLIHSERGVGANRNKKMVYLKVDDINICFPEKIYQEFQRYSTNLKLGHFTDFSVTPTCGLATIEDVVGKADDPKYFMDAKRVDASLLWFSSGFVEYKIPNLLQENETPEMLEISFEIASEFPLSNNVWPSDISIYVNDVKVAVYTVPGNFSDIRGRYTPEWWNDSFSQYGLLKHLRINKLDTGIDGEAYSDVTIEDLKLRELPFIKLRFSVEDDAKHQGGLTLFGTGFGNHQQDILITTYYLKK